MNPLIEIPNVAPGVNVAMTVAPCYIVAAPLRNQALEQILTRFQAISPLKTPHQSRSV